MYSYAYDMYAYANMHALIYMYVCVYLYMYTHNLAFLRMFRRKFLSWTSTRPF